jgi:hypothetical protein
MTKKSYVLNFSIIVGVSAALLLFIFILVSHHRDIPDRVVQDRGALLATGSSAAELIKPVGQADVPSAETKRAPAKKAAAAPPPSKR